MKIGKGLRMFGIYLRVGGKKNRQTLGPKDRWTERLTDRLLDGQLDEQIVKYLVFGIHLSVGGKLPHFPQFP